MKLLRGMIFFVLGAILLSVPSYAQSNPFAPKSKSTSNTTDAKKVTSNPFAKNTVKVRKRQAVLFPGFVGRIARIQRKLNQKIAFFANEIKQKGSLKYRLLAMFFAFLFGVVHAAGPGHGKVFTLSYFMSDNADIKKGLLLGNMIAFLHAAMAVVLVFVLNFIIKHSFLKNMENSTQVMKLISYALIFAVGVYMLISHIRTIKKKQIVTEYSPDVSTKNTIAMALAIGLVPCPATSTVLLFMVSIDILLFGLVLAFFIALGMGFTISLVGIATIAAKKGTIKIFSKQKDAQSKIGNIFEIGGAILIILLGLSFFLLSL